MNMPHTDYSPETLGLTREQYRKQKLREYNAAYRKKYKDVIQARQAQWVLDNPEKVAASKVKWRTENPETDLRLKREHYLKNKAYYNEKAKQYWREHKEEKKVHTRSRRAILAQATPAWADKKAMRKLWHLAGYQGLAVDHIVPLVSRYVCGLHWEANLQIITKRENSQKRNFHWPDMPDLSGELSRLLSP